MCVFGVKCWKPPSAISPLYLIFRKFGDLSNILCTRFPASWNHKLSYDIIFVGIWDIADMYFSVEISFRIWCSWLLNLSILRDNRAGVCLYLPSFCQCWIKCGTFSCQVVTDVMQFRKYIHKSELIVKVNGDRGTKYFTADANAWYSTKEKFYLISEFNRNVQRYLGKKIFLATNVPWPAS